MKFEVEVPDEYIAEAERRQREVIVYLKYRPPNPDIVYAATMLNYEQADRLLPAVRDCRLAIFR